MVLGLDDPIGSETLAALMSLSSIHSAQRVSPHIVSLQGGRRVPYAPDGAAQQDGAPLAQRQQPW